MRLRGFATSFSDLPATLPVFPLPGVLLLPSGLLPLNIFEPRYLAMTDDALGADRLIGMIQPVAGPENATEPELYQTGCAGRITAFSETEDGRYLITLSGVARFNIRQELDSMRGYRRVVPDWAPYQNDFAPPGEIDIDRDRLLEALRGYFTTRGIKADWDAIKRMDDAKLVTTLAMICPFDPPEKQALLVAAEISERALAMMALLEMAAHPTGGTEDARH